MMHVEEALAGMVRLAREGGSAFSADGCEIAPEHRRHQFDLADVRHGAREHRLAVAHDRYAIADRIELVELVADEDHRNALALELADDVEQDLDLALVERGGGLVHDHQPRLEGYRARNGDHLLDRRAEAGEGPADVDVHLEPAQHLGRMTMHFRPPEESEARRSVPEADVLGHRPVGYEIDLLVDGADSGALGLLRCAELGGSPFEQDFARILAVSAGQHLDERGLAGAVLADEGHHLPRQHFERGGLPRLDA
jgi:hypothetical protein